MQIRSSRRRFLAGLSAASAAVVFIGPRSAHAEPPLETTTVRLGKGSSPCGAPVYVAEDLLRDEGFSDIRYVPTASNYTSVSKGEIDFGTNFAAPTIISMDAGGPITVVAGVHVGCFELFADKRIQRITDLKGKSVGVKSLDSSQYSFLASMATYVGLDPGRDINWVTSTSVKPMDLFVDGKIDAFLGLPPEPQELRGRDIGHVIVNSAVDRPWSQYFCCMLLANKDYVHAYPVATKRVLRAILKAADLCVTEPQSIARRLVDGGLTDRYEYALEVLTEIPYDKWREYDPEDTIRFYALRLHEAGLIKSSPQEIIAAGTDWRFLNEVKQELKG